ncbi:MULTISPECIES: GntR family transcriptional regulator [Eubacterium]|uniref:GntR family transcriptional regulator n=1 Tax=Eubacterium barkeri TaxID=1528 RepID=A0A1H3JF57_EUBBA|nr:GntR family transcriptional regulator [Eubacterium barkeri]SDY37854.1 GntR family transcriptional regulator [Eubacterium barkeri]
MYLDKNLNEPLYHQLFNIMRNDIENHLDEGDQLDSERDICAKYQVSRTTVRQALDKLENEGYIEKIHGKGNFVANRLISQDLVRFYSFSEEMRKLGKTPHSKLTSFEIVEAGETLAHQLGIAEGELAFKLIRIRYADETPMLYESTFLPMERFKGLTAESISTRSMYDVLQDDFGVHISNGEEVLRPILVNRVESLYLDIPEGSPGLKITRTTREGNRVIEYTRSIARGDKFKYRVYLENEPH